jgi:EmrB/QacA subfamily drug resistance transporter
MPERSLGSVTTTSPSVVQPGIRRGPVLAIVLVSYLMIVLDISIVITALPQMRTELGFSAPQLSWVQNAYTLAFGGLLLLGARAGDILGRRRTFLAGLALFTAASIAIGFAPSPVWLLGARAMQGVGAAILAPSSLALLTTTFPAGPERTRAIGYYGAVAGVGASLGLVVGGILTDWTSWRAGFFLNAPIGVVLLLAARRLLPETERRPGRLDLPGALTSTVGMTALVYGLVRSADAGWADLGTGAALVTGVVLLVLFVLNERHAGQPILPLRLFASRERAGAYAGRLLFLGGMLSFWFFVTLYLQGVLGLSPLQTGFAFLPTTLVNFAVALSVPWLTRRLGNGRLLAVSLLLAVIGMAWLGRVDADSSYLTAVALPMLLIGAGQGGALAPLTSAGVSGVAAEDAGAAGGLVNVAHQLGGSLGLATLVAVFAAAASPDLAGTELLAHQVGAAVTAGAGLLALALVVVLALIVRPGQAAPTAPTITAGATSARH